ncbi:GMC family oxidoreductase N-terminal domain-containing protein [soil metagenome]
MTSSATTEVFDIVIVGAGSAGCALARQLTEDSALDVALVEAGGWPHHPFIAAPTEYFKLWGTEIDWDYESIAQPGTSGRRHRLPRGRVLGGTSAINGMVYLRGARQDFDGWAGAGCAGWGWDRVRRSYEQLEELVRPTTFAKTNELSDVFIDAATDVGYRFNPFFDDGDLDGCGWNRLSIHEGERQSSYRAFVEPVLLRPNLQIITEATVERLEISPDARVTGVELRDVSGSVRRISAGEVVVCAGAYESARLLMVSGIGPAAHLHDRGITPLVDLPVGENLQDHLLVGVVQTATRQIDPLYAHITEACAFGRSSSDVASCDIEISFNKEMHFAPPVDDGVPRFTIIPGVTRLQSRGTVRLPQPGSSSRLDIDHAYFEHAGDMTAMVEAVRRSRAIAGSPAFAEWSSGEYFPGPEVETDEEIATYVRDNVSTWFHPAGSCKMGTSDDAVVRPDLRVRGTSGLRVADASVMPTVVTVNTNAASMMIGWRAADFVLGR